MTRRRVLAFITEMIGTALGLALAVPAAALLVAPTRRPIVFGAEKPLDAGALGQFPEGKLVRVALRAPSLRDAWAVVRDVPLGSVWLRREGERVRVFSAVCPHAGCAVDWDESASRFECPCHASAFGADGARVAGPSPRGLDELPVTVEDGRVRVTWRRFRPGVPDREPV